MPTLPTPERDLITAIEIDLWDGEAIQTLRISDGTVFGPEAIEDNSLSSSFRPCLYVPVEIRYGIISDGLDDVMPSSGDGGGTIKFSLRDSRPGHHQTPPPIWSSLDMNWLGREGRIYTGERDALFGDYELSYVFRVDDLTHDTFDVTVKAADVSLDLDDVLVPYLYDVFAVISGEGGVPEVLKGKPLPELRGRCFNIPAILLSDTDFGAPLYYQVSRLPLDEISEVRVGGIPWDMVLANPVAGQWQPLLSAGSFVLGGITGGLDVRCDASSVGGASLTTASLMTDLVTEAGGEVNEEAMTQLSLDAPYAIGWWTGAEAMNRLDAFNKIMASVGGWWRVDLDGKIAAGLYKRAGPFPDTTEYTIPEFPTNLDDIDDSFVVGSGPIIISRDEEQAGFSEDDADFVLRDNIASIQLIKTLPQVWRVGVEHTHNWGPLTSFADAVREVDQQVWQNNGKLAPAWEDQVVKLEEPRAVDLPTIESLVTNELDALLIRNRIASIFGITRRIYEVKAYIDAPEPYSVAYVDYMMVLGFYRVISVTRGFGAGPVTIQIWG